MARPLVLAAVIVTLLSGCGVGNAGNPPFGGIRNPASEQVSVTPDTLNFTALGAGAAQSVSVFQSKLDASYKESDNCSGVATVAQSGILNGTATYSMTPVGAGGCTATFKGIGPNTGTLTVSSLPYGSVMPNPTSFSFIATGASYAQTLGVSQVNYSGTFGESDTCSGIATITQTSNSGGAATYTVTPTAAGTCQITISGGNGETSIIGVTVTTTSLEAY